MQILKKFKWKNWEAHKNSEMKNLYWYVSFCYFIFPFVFIGNFKVIIFHKWFYVYDNCLYIPFLPPSLWSYLLNFTTYLFIYLYILAWFFPLVFCCILDLLYICNFADINFSSVWTSSCTLDRCVYWLHFMKHVVFYLCCFISKLIFSLQNRFADLLSFLLPHCSLVFFIFEFSKSAKLCYCI